MMQTRNALMFFNRGKEKRKGGCRKKAKEKEARWRMEINMECIPKRSIFMCCYIFFPIQLLSCHLFAICNASVLIFTEHEQGCEWLLKNEQRWARWCSLYAFSPQIISDTMAKGTCWIFLQDLLNVNIQKTSNKTTSSKELSDEKTGTCTTELCGVLHVLCVGCLWILMFLGVLRKPVCNQVCNWGQCVNTGMMSCNGVSLSVPGIHWPA